MLEFEQIVNLNVLEFNFIVLVATLMNPAPLRYSG